MISSNKRHLLILYSLTITFIVLFSLLAYLRYRAFFSYEWEDLSSSNYLLWNLSKDNILDAISNYSNNFATRVHIFPYIIFPALLYGLIGKIEALFIINAIVIFSPAIILYYISREKLISTANALMISLTYLFYAPKSSLVFLDGDMTIHAIYLLFLCYFFYQKKWFKSMWISLILIGSLRTETPLLAASFSLFIFLKSKNRKAIWAMILFLIWLLINLRVYSIINKDEDLSYLASINDHFDLNFFSPYFFFIWEKVKLLFFALLPLLFIPVLQLEIILSITGLILFFMAIQPLPQQGHYLAIFYAALFLGFVSYAEKLRKPNRFIFVALIASIMSNFLPNTMGYLNTTNADSRIIQDKRFITSFNIFDPIFYFQDNEDKIAWKLIAQIPPKAKVVASSDLLPPLSSRKDVGELYLPGTNEDNFEYLISRKHYMYLGAGAYAFDPDQLQSILHRARSLNSKWTILYEDDNFIFLKKKQ